MDPFGDGNNIARFRLLAVCSESIYRRKILGLVLDHVLNGNKYTWSPQDPDGRGRTNYLFPIMWALYRNIIGAEFIGTCIDFITRN